MFILYNPNFTGEADCGPGAGGDCASCRTRRSTPEELERVKTQLRATLIKQMQSSLGRAQQLGQYEIADGDAALINTEFERMLNVSAGADSGRREEVSDARQRRAVLAVQSPRQTKEGK